MQRIVLFFLASSKNDWFIFNLNEVENKKAGILSKSGLITNQIRLKSPAVNEVTNFCVINFNYRIC